MGIKMKERFGREVPKWLRMIGAQRINRDSIDFKWGYFAPEFGLKLFLRNSYNDEFCVFGLNLGWGGFSFNLPFMKPKGVDGEIFFKEKQYGIRLVGNTILYDWGTKGGMWDIPFVSSKVVRKEVFTDGMVWEETAPISYPTKYPPKEFVFDYCYTRRSGQKQNVVATAKLERYTIKRKWIPFYRQKKQSLWVKFSSEIGEGTGSWKGGVVGCGCDLNPGESVEDAIRRMEREKRFNR